MVRLAIADASVPQIAAATGHSRNDVEAILDAHYLGRDIQLAEAAVLTRRDSWCLEAIGLQGLEPNLTLGEVNSSG